MAETPETILDAALYVAREFGAYVIELDHPDLPTCAGSRVKGHTAEKCKRGKDPIGHWPTTQTNTVREIAAKFTASTRNYGVTTRRSGLVVIDEDTATLDEYAASIGETVPATFEVRTGRPGGGRHLWFRAPDGVDLTNARGKLPKGIDVRAGKDGYVVGPGSKHASGNVYTATWDRRPVQAPQWLVDALTPPPVDEHDDQADDAGTAEIAPRVAELLALPVTPEVDKSDRVYAIVGAAKATGMSKAATTLALLPWCAANKKYVSRVPEEVARCWKKLPAPGEQPAAEDKPEPKSAATLLVEIAEERYTFGTSEEGEPFAIPRDGGKVVQMLRGGKMSLRSQLAKTFFARYRKVAAQQALTDALAVIEGMAQDDPEQNLALRVAQADGALWLDLGDATGRAVRITAAGWTVEDTPPVLFKRTALMASLPEPEAGGDLDELWHWLNVTKEDRPLVAAYLVAALRPDLPHPVLDLSGEQGSGKTTAQKVLVKVIDPGPVPNRKPPRDADSWVTAAAGSWMVGLDNLSAMPDWLSDSICRAVTGDGDVRRRLYTDGDLSVFAFRRCVVITGIDLGAVSGDLAERTLPIHLDTIPADERLEEGDLWPGWHDAHPRILGAVLDLAASVARVHPTVRLESKPRMADFARILACVDNVLGTEGFARYLGKQGTLATESLTDDEFVTAIEEALTDAITFIGTASQLLKLVTPNDEKWRAPKEWPKTSRVVTQRLRRQAPVMRKAGWSIDDDGGQNKDHAVRWTILRPEMGRNPGSPTSSSSPASQASQASNEYGPSPDTCPDCTEPYDSLTHQVDCEGLDS